MSDFLFASRRRAPGELREVLHRYLGAVAAEIVEHHGAWGSLAVVRAPHDGEIVVEDERSITVLVGLPIAWIAPHGPGLAARRPRRHAVHELLATGPALPWHERLDSGFAALRVDTERGGGMVLTDIASFVPIFFAEDGGVILGTHPDAVARAAGRHRDIDEVSAADLLLNFSSTYPHTLFRGVEQFPPATARGFGPGGAWMDDAHVYWRPTEENPYASRADAATALREALLENLRDACGELPVAGILLSGGEDARAVLGAIPPGPEVRAFVYADWENREVRVARDAARAYGAELTFGARRPDHYLDALETVAPLLGSGQLFMDVHGYGFHESLGLRELPIVLGGLSSDSFLKAQHAPPATSPGAPFPLPVAPELRADLLQAVAERRTAFRRWLEEFRPTTAQEWEKLYPFTQRKHAANFHGNRRLFASHEPYHSVAVVALAGSVPLPWKQGRALFHQAMKPLFAPSWHVPHARWRYPYFGRAANLPLTVGLRVARGVRAVLAGEVRARQGPWPKWRSVVESPLMAEKRRAYPVTGSPIAAAFNATREEEVERAVAQWHPLSQLLLLQLSYLTRAE
jgi:hypothetical protein